MKNKYYNTKSLNVLFARALSSRLPSTLLSSSLTSVPDSASPISSEMPKIEDLTSTCSYMLEHLTKSSSAHVRHHRWRARRRSRKLPRGSRGKCFHCESFVLGDFCRRCGCSEEMQEILSKLCPKFGRSLLNFFPINPLTCVRSSGVLVVVH